MRLHQLLWGLWQLVLGDHVAKSMAVKVANYHADKFLLACFTRTYAEMQCDERLRWSISARHMGQLETTRIVLEVI